MKPTASGTKRAAKRKAPKKADPRDSGEASPKTSSAGATVRLIQGPALPFLQSLEASSFPMIYVDPPFNTGKRQQLNRTRTSRDAEGDRVGFGGERYRTQTVSKMGYLDSYSDYLSFLGPHLEQAARVLDPGGSLFVHLDAREIHYAKVFLDGVFGRECFMNEIIWAYDFGGRSRSKWSSKHDSILWYVKDPKNYTFRFEDMDRIPYLAPGLVGPEKAKRGKTPTDVWWNTIVSTAGKERTGYPNQKPRAILDRLVRVHSNPGDTILDFFAGSGTTGEAAFEQGRSAVLVDQNPEAIAVIKKRLKAAKPEFERFKK